MLALQVSAMVPGIYSAGDPTQGPEQASHRLTEFQGQAVWVSEQGAFQYCVIFTESLTPRLPNTRLLHSGVSTGMDSEILFGDD